MERRGLFGALGIAVFVAGLGTFLGYIVQQAGSGSSGTIPWTAPVSRVAMVVAAIGLVIVATISVRMSLVQTRKRTIARFIGVGNELFTKAQKLANDYDPTPLDDLPPDHSVVGLQGDIDEWVDQIDTWFGNGMSDLSAVFHNQAGTTNAQLMAGSGAVDRLRFKWMRI